MAANPGNPGNLEILEILEMLESLEIETFFSEKFYKFTI